MVTIGMSLVISSILVHISLADTNEVRWSPVPIPGDGESGKWMLASGGDTKYLTVAADGTLYCYANPDSTNNTLFKSIDDGLSWSSIGQVRDTIIAIAVVPNDAATLYYATTSMVYRSSDAGATFIPLPSNPGGAGSNNIQITALAVTRIGTSNLVAVGTRDTDFGHYGGVYFLDESSTSGLWQNTGISANNVYHLAFSPDYANDGLLVAVTSNTTDTLIRSKIGNNGWGQVIGDAYLPAVTPLSATVSFPPNYTATASFFFALDTGINNGDVFRITPEDAPLLSVVTALGVGVEEGLSSVDITSLTNIRDTMSVTLIAGCARQARTYVSFDEGVHWIRSQKSPAGQSDTRVVAASSFTSQQKVYAVTCGTESAFSVSLDNGVTWYQTSLIDSKITSLVDFAAMPTEPVAVLFLVTHDSIALKYHLWKSQDNGNQWQSLFSSDLPGNTFHLVKVTGDGSLFLAGQSNGNPAIWISKDTGQTFISHPAPCFIDTWTFMDASTFFIGGYDGSRGVVYRTDNGGVFYSVAGGAGTRTLSAITLSPDYAQDQTLAAGNTGGQVFISYDAGISFQSLGQELPVTSGTGKVSLAFDGNFTNNGIVYAAVDTKTTSTSSERLFSFTIGESSAWHSMYSSLPEDAVISRIAVTNNGTFYAINGQGVVTADSKGGLLRSLTPASQSAFEITARGLDETATLKGLWIKDNRLWSLDSKNIMLMTLVDNLTIPVTLESPLDGASGTGTDIRLKWQAIAGASEYEWQINDEESFSSVPAGFSGTTSTTAAQLAALKTATTYYWRVRAITPFHSPWSLVQSFTTLIGGENVAPELSFPVAGSIVGINPVFLWNTVPGADRYELLVAGDTTFNEPVIYCTGEQALLTNAWQCEINLEYDTNYFWKVRACTAANFGEWSAINIFTTETAPAPTAEELNSMTHEQSSDQSLTLPTAESQQQPLATAAPIQLNIPNWVLYTGLALLVVIVLLLAILIVVFLTSRRLRKDE